MVFCGYKDPPFIIHPPFWNHSFRNLPILKGVWTMKSGFPFRIALTHFQTSDRFYSEEERGEKVLFYSFNGLGHYHGLNNSVSYLSPISYCIDYNAFVKISFFVQITVKWSKNHESHDIRRNHFSKSTIGRQNERKQRW